MAKRVKGAPSGAQGQEQPEEAIGPRHEATMGLAAGGPEGGGDPLGDFAADLGRFLGGVQNRAASWLDQRNAIAEQLTQIRDTANGYLQQLAGGAAAEAKGARRGRPPGRAARKPAGSPAPEAAVEARPKRSMSPEARERIAAAQRKRWAQHRRAARGANR